MLPASRRASLTGVAVLCLAAGCKTLPPPTPDETAGALRPWAEQRDALASLDHYGLAGRVAVAAGDEGFSASLRYEQRAPQAELALDGPLGIGGLRVALDGEQLRITTSRGETLDGAAARAELERRLGFALPLEQLRWWLLGVPDPTLPAVETTGIDGVTATFEQDGWQVSIAQRDAALGFLLPRRLTAQREGARLRLVVDRWHR